MTMPVDGSIGKLGRCASVQADQEILRATLEELAAVGFEALSIARVAARAVVGKTTIYGRWPSKDELVLAAVQHIQIGVPLRDMGHLREDLLGILRSALAVGSQEPLALQLLVRTLSDLQARPNLFQGWFNHLLLQRLQRFLALIQRAQGGGEVRQDLDPSVALMLMFGPILYAWFLGATGSGVKPKTNLAEPMVDAVLQGIAAVKQAPTFAARGSNSARERLMGLEPARRNDGH